MDKRKDPSSVDIKSILLDMRKYRMGLIQTPDQLRFSYMAVLEGSKYIMGDLSVQVPAPHTPSPILSTSTPEYRLLPILSLVVNLETCPVFSVVYFILIQSVRAQNHILHIKGNKSLPANEPQCEQFFNLKDH